MHRPFSFVAVLLLALVTSAGGYVLANAFCTDARMAEATCHQMGQASPRARHEHAAMTHDSQVANVNAAVLPGEQLFETCSHCVSHSNLPQPAFDLRQAEAPQLSKYIGGQVAVANVAYDVVIPCAIYAREHAPPGNSAPLHVRLNVFRI